MGAAVAQTVPPPRPFFIHFHTHLHHSTLTSSYSAPWLLQQHNTIGVAAEVTSELKQGGPVSCYPTSTTLGSAF